MAKHQTDLPIKPFEKDGHGHNVIRLHLDYDKNVKGPVLYLQTGEIPKEEPGANFSSFRFVIFGSPSARVVLERNWPRNNAKRLEAAWDQVAAEVAGKRGESYAAILKVLEPVGSRLGGEEPAVAAEPADRVPLNQQLPGLDAALGAAIGTPGFLLG